MPSLTHHPLIVAMTAKRQHYLDNGRHAEAHGVAASLMIVWAYLQRKPAPLPTSTQPIALDERMNK